MIVGDLFSGIGGFSLAADWIGWRTAWFSEIDPYASAMLAHHWPGVPNHGDIRLMRGADLEPVDMLVGGFPCQDISNAGKREGITGDRSGLWTEYARLIGECRPRWVVIENVAALLRRGYDVVRRDLRAHGYRCARPVVMSASQVGAPHLRERLWLVAYDDRPRRREFGQGDAGSERLTGRNAAGRVRDQRTPADSIGLSPERHRGPDDLARPTSSTQGEAQEREWGGNAVSDCRETPPHAASGGQRISRRASWGHRLEDGLCPTDSDPERERSQGVGQAWPTPGPVDRSGHGRDPGLGATQPGVRGVDDGIPHWSHGSPVYPTTPGTPHRRHRLKGLGNAIVPQCALPIFLAIHAADTHQETVIP